jgi:hypothetical protein
MNPGGRSFAWTSSHERRPILQGLDIQQEIALGSQAEMEVQLETALRLGYCELADYKRIQERVARVGRMLNGLIASVRRRSGQAQS